MEVVDLGQKSLRMTDEPHDALADRAHLTGRVFRWKRRLGSAPSGMSGLVKLVTSSCEREQKSRDGKARCAHTNEHADRLNWHDQALNPTTTLTRVSVQLAVALTCAPGDGVAVIRPAILTP